MAYCTTAQVKDSMQKTDAGDDALIARIIAGAERKINQFCNRPDGFEADAVASARYYKGSGKVYQLIDECVEISAVAVKDSLSDATYTAWTAPSTMFAGDGDWFPGTGDPDDPEFNLLPYTLLFVDPNGDYAWFTGEDLWQKKRGRNVRGTNALLRAPTVQVTAKWGYSVAVPDDIVECCIAQTMRWYKAWQGATAPQLATTEMGTLTFPALDPNIQDILVNGRYKRPAVGRR